MMGVVVASLVALSVAFYHELRLSSLETELKEVRAQLGSPASIFQDQERRRKRSAGNGGGEFAHPEYDGPLLQGPGRRWLTQYARIPVRKSAVEWLKLSPVRSGGRILLRGQFAMSFRRRFDRWIRRSSWSSRPSGPKRESRSGRHQRRARSYWSRGSTGSQRSQGRSRIPR